MAHYLPGAMVVGGVNGTRAVEEKDWTRRGNSGFCIWYLDKYMYLYVVLLWSILYTYIYVCFLYAFVHICTHTNTLVCRHTICWIKDALPETSKPGTWSSRFIRWCHPMMCVCFVLSNFSSWWYLAIIGGHCELRNTRFSLSGCRWRSPELVALGIFFLGRNKGSSGFLLDQFMEE